MFLLAFACVSAKVFFVRGSPARAPLESMEWAVWVGGRRSQQTTVGFMAKVIHFTLGAQTIF